jgi:hypothetical protein
MERFSADEFIKIANQLNIMKRAAENLPVDNREPINSSLRKTYLDALKNIVTNCEKIGLRTTVKAANYAYWRIENPDTDFRDVASVADQVLNNIRWEMHDILFFHVPSERTSYYDKKELFGKYVIEKFPAIQFDMVEAGNCYAMGRGTASVFHLMRIMEVGVQEFGKKLGVTLVNQKVWQIILDGINSAIKGLPPKDVETIAMSQASANLYAVKLAWRNEVMHPKDTYTLEESENILRQVKIFMEQLATII